MPEGDVTQFPDAPMIDLSAIFQPAWETPLWFLAERTLQVAVVKERETFALDHLLFESVDAVSEPATGLLVGLGVIGVAWLARHRRGRSLLLLLGAMGVLAPVITSAQEVTIQKAGSGTGLVVVGERVCDFLCDSMRVPYTEKTTAVLKVIPDADSIFAGWRQGDGTVISGKIHIQPDETITAILQRRDDFPTPLYAGHQVFVTIKAGADPQAVVALKAQTGVIAAEPFPLDEELWSVTRTTDEALAILTTSPLVGYAGPDYLISVSEAIPTEFYDSAALPGTGNAYDPWWLRRIQTPEAWDITAGGEMIIAVLDTGVDYTHPDLKQNMWVNPKGVGDGLHGYDFIDNDPDSMDGVGHGTHVAGLIGRAPIMTAWSG